jgi:BASS family bile acid:Na+ symporter
VPATGRPVAVPARTGRLGGGRGQHLKAILDISVLVVNVAMMMAVGMGLEAGHFKELARRRRMVPAALIGQMVLLPVIGWCITRVMVLPPHLCAGILLMAACPVGSIASFFTSLARANTALSVAVNMLSCLLAAPTMAAVFEFYGRLAGERFVFAAPSLQLGMRVMLMTAVPVAAGMVLRRVVPRFTSRIGSVIQAACVVGIAGVIVLVAVVQTDLLTAEWKPAAAASLALMSVAMAAGWLTSALMGLPTAERMTFAVVFSTRNVALASAVAVALMGRVDYAAFGVVYFLTEVPLLLGVVGLYRRRQARSGWASCAGTIR